MQKIHCDCCDTIILEGAHLLRITFHNASEDCYNIKQLLRKRYATDSPTDLCRDCAKRVDEALAKLPENAPAVKVGVSTEL